jgi:sortase A
MSADALRDAVARSKVAKRWLRRGERLCLVAGAALIAWWALLLADARLAQHNARRALELASQAAGRVSVQQINPPGTIAATSTEGLRQGEVIALLSVPRIDLSAAVLQGSDSRTLRRGPGHVENTALPGEPGNVVIAGHRDSFFRPLRDIRVGDDVFVSTARERIHYTVSSLKVVGPRDLSVLAPTGAPTLTLITCFPFWVLGDAPDRFVVRATRAPVPIVEPATAVAVVPPEPEPAEPLQPARPAPVRDGRPSGAAAAVTALAADDDTLVRRLIERFRVSYNARLVHEPAFRGARPLTFDGCDVSIDGERATATCSSPASPQDGAAVSRAFALERTGDGWRIRLVTIGAGPAEPR